ncbi:MFS transporter [Streptomyces sp. Ru87]|nr:MFS transporter [Streptomyces sp. Ru87]
MMAAMADDETPISCAERTAPARDGAPAPRSATGAAAGTVAGTAGREAGTAAGPAAGTPVDAAETGTASSANAGPAGAGSAGAGSTAGGTAARAARAGAWLLPAGIVLAALNLRPAITSLGALLEEVRDGLGMSGSVAGLLTSVPSLCFAVFGVTAPRLARRWGLAGVVCAGMAAIGLGVLVRPFAGGTGGFLAASALALAGIAVANVLMPVIVKRWFPDRVGTMTGLYSMALALGTALAAAATVPVTGALGGSWRGGLAIWAVLAVAALLVWAPLALGRRDGGRPHRTNGTNGTNGTEKADGSDGADSSDSSDRSDSSRPAAGPGRGVRISASPTARALGCFFGLQATAAYVTMGWLPQILRDAGVPASSAGVLLAVTMGLGIPLSYVLPRVAASMRHQSPLAVLLGVCGLSGYAGLYLAPAAAPWAWALLLGVSNCAFPLVLTLIGMRARTGPGVVRLSAFAQSTGYLISIPGPLLVGVLYQHSGGWGLPLGLMAALMVPQILLGVRAGRDRYVEDEIPARTPAR